jgi:uncharacterized membrane protein YhhN
VRDNEIMRYYSKPLLIPMIAAFYLIMDPQTNAFIVAALCFAFIGDVLLLFSANNTCFRLGAISFMLGHIGFMCAMLFSIDFGEMSFNHYLWPIIPSFLPSVVAFAILGKHFGKFKLLAAIYMLAGSGLMYCALLRFGFFLDYKVWQTIIGAIFFVISDFFIAWTRFKKDFRYSGVVIMSTYVFAEICIILGLMVPLL